MLQLPHPHPDAGVWALGDDERIAWIAERQRGAVGRGQLLAVGLSARQVGERLRRRRLHPLYRGVYLAGHPVPAPSAREVGALVACEGGVLSHRTAAGLHGLCELPEIVHVTTLRDIRRKGIAVHRTTSLVDAVSTRGGLPVTTVARALVDLADTEPAACLERLVAEAERRRLVRRDELVVPNGRHGAAKLAEILDEGPRLTRSEAERRLLALVRGARLPTPESNQRVGRFEVDLLWREQRLIAEVDGFAFHGDRLAFERDRERDQQLQLAGFRVLRITWRQLDREPLAVAARLAQALR